ncbi:hypothetical protein [Streptomyces sp. NEAU-H3]|uniref:hypothetical protein n=1 Tax=Streptomyces sp. NEAU-H3 TaxID=2720636 RepID=UPI001FD756C8|nr:hypothetical protein [Streptomyces sp. NEAU-H3]
MTLHPTRLHPTRLHPTRLHPTRLHPARRALRLASALAVTGLCVGLAPQALAAGTAGTGGAMKLSGAQADKLAAHAALDPYGDGGKAENPTKPEDTTAPKTAGKTAGKTPGKTAGETPGKNVRKGAETDAADAPVTFTAQSTLEGARGMGATVPVGKNGDYFLLTSLGTVQRRAADGTSVWERTNSSLYQDWKVSPQRPWQTEPYPARVLMGYNAVSPFTPSSDIGYATGDLTGDGTDDLVFTASVGAVPYRPFISPGSALPTGTFVTVVDGRTGATVWSKLYDYASHVRIADHTLLVADSPRQNTDAPAADTAKLTGTRFSYAAGVLTPSMTWKTENAAGRGRTLLLAAADGSVTWSTDSLLYSRQLRPDSPRKRIVAVEQSDATDGVRYEIAAYDLGSGRRATLDSRVNVLPTALAVGDLTSREGAEYAVAESSLDDNLYVNASTVRALDGADPHRALWSSTILVTSAQDDERNGTAQNMGGGRLASLTVFSGKGAVKWQEKGLGASPMYQDVFDDAGGGHVRVVDQNENVRTYRLGNGKKESLTPLRADMAYAKATDVNKDGTDDVVMAGSSNGVWAYSGPSLATGRPEQLWQATVPGAVHDIETGDVNGAATACSTSSSRPARSTPTTAPGTGSGRTPRPASPTTSSSPTPPRARGGCTSRTPSAARSTCPTPGRTRSRSTRAPARRSGTSRPRPRPPPPTGSSTPRSPTTAPSPPRTSRTRTATRSSTSGTSSPRPESAPPTASARTSTWRSATAGPARSCTPRPWAACGRTTTSSPTTESSTRRARHPSAPSAARAPRTPPSSPSRSPTAPASPPAPEAASSSSAGSRAVSTPGARTSSTRPTPTCRASAAPS